MTDLNKLLITKSSTIREAMSTINEGNCQLALVVENEVLLGTITDGDLRSAILDGATLEDSVANIYNDQPKTIQVGASKNQILDIMKVNSIRHLPLVDENNKLKDLVFLDDFISINKKTNKVVLMAGGLGTRLHPYTKDCPKPLLEIGGKPILEWTLDSFIMHGFVDFYISVNFKSQMIKDYFGDGSKWGVKIQYIEETKKLGTAGCLSLVEKFNEPFIVMNGDIITHIDFSSALEKHINNNFTATVCTQTYHYQVPYGVIEQEGDRIVSIVEKPIKKYQTNAGIYVLSPEIMDDIPKNEFFDMPDLLKIQIEKKKRLGTFTILNSLLDIGQKDEFLKAKERFSSLHLK